MTLRHPAPALAAAMFLVACSNGSTPSSSPRNTAPAPRSLTLAPDEPLGWLALAPTPTADRDASWLPVDAHAVVVPPAETLPTGTPVTAVPSRGAPVRATIGAPATVAFGCDGNRLDVLVVDAPRVAPGMVWLLPRTAPAAWQPSPLAITAARATPVHRHYTVGPLVLELSRQRPMTATLVVTRAGRPIYTQPIERGTEMAGAETPPIDLTTEGPGVPAPVAAWALGDAGPILVALVTPTWEGIELSALLVESERARIVEPMTTYLYRCAY